MKEGIFSTTALQKIKTIILSIVIAIVLASFVVYLIESINPSPKYEDYCDNIRGYSQPVYDGKENLLNDTECIATNGTWRNGYCDYYYECQNEFNNVSDKHKNYVFFISVPVGLIAVTAGIIIALPSVSSGLMLGGVFLTIYGTAQYWDNLSNWLRSLILGIVLIILIWLAYKKLRS